ncbi:MAG: site-specific integrase, partial [Rickettsiales bacterium]|nr:site-specific integrase [Rickettsiales bacterium]
MPVRKRRQSVVLSLDVVAMMLTPWADYLSNIRRYAAPTVAAYLSDAKEFLGFIQSYKGEEVDFAHCATLTVSDYRSWMASRARAGLSATSTMRALSAVRSLHRYWQREGRPMSSAIFDVSIRPKGIRVP